jgi:hypothetical protein
MKQINILASVRPAGSNPSIGPPSQLCMLYWSSDLAAALSPTKMTTSITTFDLSINFVFLSPDLHHVRDDWYGRHSPSRTSQINGTIDERRRWVHRHSTPSLAGNWHFGGKGKSRGRTPGVVTFVRPLPQVISRSAYSCSDVLPFITCGGTCQWRNTRGIPLTLCKA